MCQCYHNVKIHLRQVTTKEERKKIEKHINNLELDLMAPSSSSSITNPPSSSSIIKPSLSQPFFSSSTSSSFKCHKCPKTFRDNFNLERHLSSHSEANIKCPKCEIKFTLQQSLKRHLLNIHSPSK